MDEQSLQPTNVKLITRSTSKKSVGHRKIVNYLENLSKDKDGAPVKWTFTKSGIHKAKGVRKKIALRVSKKVEKIQTTKKILGKKKITLNVKDSEKTKDSKKGKLKPETMSDNTQKKSSNVDNQIDQVQNINSDSQSETSLVSKPPDVVKKRKVGRPKVKKNEEMNENSKEAETNENLDKNESAKSNDNNVQKEVLAKRGPGRPRKNPSWTVLQKKMYSSVLKKAVNTGIKTHLNDHEDNYDSSSSSLVSNTDSSHKKKVYKSYNRQGIKLGPRKMLRSQDNLITRQKRGGGASFSGLGGRRKRTLSGEFELLEEPVRKKRPKKDGKMTEGDDDIFKNESQNSETLLNKAVMDQGVNCEDIKDSGKTDDHINRKRKYSSEYSCDNSRVSLDRPSNEKVPGNVQNNEGVKMTSDTLECRERDSNTSIKSSNKCHDMISVEKDLNQEGNTSSGEKRKRGRPKVMHTTPNMDMKPKKITHIERPPIPLSPEVIIKRSLKIVGPGGVKFTKAIKDVKNPTSSTELSANSGSFNKKESCEFQLPVSDISKKLTEAVCKATDSKGLSPLQTNNTETKSKDGTNVLSDEKIKTKVLDKSTNYQNLPHKSLGSLEENKKLIFIDSWSYNCIDSDDNEKFIENGECLQDIEHKHFVDIVEKQENKMCAYYLPLQNQKTSSLDSQNQKTEGVKPDSSTMKIETTMQNKSVSGATEQKTMQLEASRDFNLDSEKSVIEHDMKEKNSVSCMDIDTLPSEIGKDSKMEINADSSTEHAVNTKQLKTDSDSDKDRSERNTKIDLIEVISKPVLSDTNVLSQSVVQDVDDNQTVDLKSNSDLLSDSKFSEVPVLTDKLVFETSVQGNASDSDKTASKVEDSNIDFNSSYKYGQVDQIFESDETNLKESVLEEKLQDEFSNEVNKNKNNNNLSLSERKGSDNCSIELPAQSSVNTSSTVEQTLSVAGNNTLQISDTEHTNLLLDNSESQELSSSKDNLTYSNEENVTNSKKTSEKRVFQLRQKASRSPLEIIAMRQSQEERQYILEQTRRAIRREEKQKRMRNKFQNMFAERLVEKDQEGGRSGYSPYDVNNICKPCSVVLIDFVKYLKDTQNSDGGDGGYTDDDTEAVDTEEEDSGNFSISGNVVMERRNDINNAKNIASVDYTDSGKKETFTSNYAEQTPSKKSVMKIDGRKKRKPSARKQMKNYPSAAKFTAEIMPSNEEENQSPTTVPPLRLKITGQDVMSRNMVPPLKLKLNQKATTKGKVGRPDKGTAIIRKRKARKGLSPVKPFNPLTEMDKLVNNSDLLNNQPLLSDKPGFDGRFVKFINDKEIPSDSNVLSKTSKIRENEGNKETLNSDVQTIEDLGKTVLQSNEMTNSLVLEKQQEQVDTFEIDFICKTCDFVTSNRNIMESHIYVHLKNVPFKCVYCQRTFRSRGVAFIHMRSVHPDQEAKMETAEDIDEREFYREVMKSAVVEQHTAIQKQPGLTGQTTPVEQHIAGQNKSVEPHTIIQRNTGLPNAQQSPEQHAFVQTNTGVQTNLQQSTDSLIISVVLPRNVTESSGRYCCSYCSFTAASQQDILDHINSNHRHDIQYTCSLCDKAVFGYKEGIAQHFADVHPNKPVMYKSMPDFYDRKGATNEKLNSGSTQDKGNIFERMNDLFSNNQQHNVSESAPDHFMEKRTSLPEKTSAEADSTTADSDDIVPNSVEREQDLNEKDMQVNSTVHQMVNAEKVYKETTATIVTPDAYSEKEVDGIEELAKIYGGSINQIDGGNAADRSNSVKGLTQLPTSIQNSSVQSTVVSSDVTDPNSTSIVDDNVVENDMGLKIVDVVSLRDSSHVAFTGASWGGQDLNQTNTQKHGESEQLVHKDTVIKSNDRPSLSVPLNIPKPKEMASVPQALSASNTSKTSERMGTTYKCERCCVHAPMLSIMVEHLRSSHRDINRLFLCPFCRQYEGSTEPDIHRHIKQFHNNPNQKSPPVALSSAAKKHLRTIQVPVGDTVKVTDGKPVVDKDIYKCLKCSKHMPSLDYIYDHLEKDHNEVFVYVCPDCKKFRAKEEEVVYNHIKTDHNKSTDNIILSLAIEENLFTRVQSLMKEKHGQTKPSANKTMSGQLHSGQSHQSNQQTVIKQTPSVNSPRQMINQNDVIVVGESNKMGSMLARQQPQQRIPISMQSHTIQPVVSPVPSPNLHSGPTQLGFVNRLPPPAHTLQGHVPINQIQSKSALRKSRPVQIRQNVPDGNVQSPITVPNRTVNIDSYNLQRYPQHISKSQSHSPQMFLSQAGPPPLMRGPPPLLRFDPVTNATSIATTALSNEQQQRIDSISQQPQGGSSVRNTSFSMTDKLQRLHKPGGVGPAQSPEPGTSPSGRPLLKVPSVTPVLGGVRSLTPQNTSTSNNVQSKLSSDRESGGASTPLDLSKGLGQVRAASTPVEKQPGNEEAEEISPDAFQIFNLRPSAPTPPNRLPTPSNVPSPYPFQRMGQQQMRPLGRLQQPLQVNMPQRLPNQMMQNRPVFMQRGVVRRPFQAPTSNVNSLTNVPVYQSSPSSFPRQVTPPTSAPQQNMATNMADMQVFKCPYCPNVVPLGIGEVAQHIEKIHPGHSIMFMKKDS